MRGLNCSCRRTKSRALRLWPALAKQSATWTGPICALPPVRGCWRLSAGAVEQPLQAVRGANQMGRVSGGPGKGVPGQQERAAQGAGARDEAG